MNRRTLLRWIPGFGLFGAKRDQIPITVHVDRELFELAKIAARARNESFEEGIVEAIRDWCSGYFLEANKPK